MTRILIKKQLMEVFSFFRKDKKRNSFRTGKNLIGPVIMYMILFAVVAAMFFVMAEMICLPLVNAGMGWVYFSIMGMTGTALGVFGSVFNTYSGLYMAKDNSMLLAMPVKPGNLLVARLSGVYAMGLMYELLVMIPALIVYYMTAETGILTVVFPILVTFVISFFVLSLSAVLGWVVALISSKTGNKSFVVVAVSLIFIFAYLYLYNRAASLLQTVVSSPETAGNFIRGSLYPVYQMGIAAVGDIKAFLIFTAAAAAVSGIIYFVLSRSYVKICTVQRGEKKKEYRMQTSKAGSLNNALFKKEIKRFISSPNYMLNCGLGIVMMIIAAAAVLIKGDFISGLIFETMGLDKGFASVVACGAVCFISCMNDITAPSVSLEGKNIWILHSFPVSGWQALKAKLKLHLVMTVIPLLILTASIEIVIKPGVLCGILIPAAASVFVIFMAEFGLVVNLLVPNLDWSSEIVPIKQSMGVMAVLFGGWVFAAAVFGLYALVYNFIGPEIYMAAAGLVLAGASFAMMKWLKKRGTEIFENL